MEQIEISEKQAIYINEATHRWNGKVGATQCGKTYIDTLYVIFLYFEVLKALFFKAFMTS